MKEEMTGWQWHQADHVQIMCTSLQTDNDASTSSVDFLQTGCFLMPSRQCQSTEDVVDGTFAACVQNVGSCL